MNDRNEVEQRESSQESQERREFLKRVGSKAVAVPAAALLIAASQEKASANGVASGRGCL